MDQQTWTETLHQANTSRAFLSDEPLALVIALALITSIVVSALAFTILDSVLTLSDIRADEQRARDVYYGKG